MLNDVSDTMKKMNKNCKLKKVVSPIQQYLNNEEISSVFVEKGVKIISQGVFQNCINLKNITFEDGSNVIRICEQAFKNTPIESIVFPDSLNALEIESFKNCKELSSVIFSSTSSIKHIKKRAFAGCINLKHISFPKKKIIIYDYTFDFNENVPMDLLIAYLINGSMNSTLKKYSAQGKKELATKQKAKEKKASRAKTKKKYKKSGFGVPSSNHSKNRHHSWYRGR